MLKVIELYTANTPNGKKIPIMLEEIGYKYNINTIDLNKGDQFKPEFKKISPFSKIPVIKDSDNNEVVFESGAILIYLAEKSGKYFDNKSIITQWFRHILREQSVFKFALTVIIARSTQMKITDTGL